jgi:transposase-like protein
MERRVRRFYPEEFKERVLTAYYSSNELVSVIARRFDTGRDTASSRVYREVTADKSGKSVKLEPLESAFMKGKEMYEEKKDLRIRKLDRILSAEKMCSESMCRMIEIAGRELKIDIGKKSGAGQSMKRKTACSNHWMHRYPYLTVDYTPVAPNSL